MVVSGMGIDGTMRHRAARKMRGAMIVREGLISEFFAMPGAAIGTGTAHVILLQA